MKRLFFIIPVAVFAALAVLFYTGLFLGPPNVLPSPLVGQVAPPIALPPLDEGAQGFDRSELGNGKPVIVNYWASWCAPCRIEHPTLEALAAKGGITLYGVDYKDKPADARRFLDELGNPFSKINKDQDGRVAIDWGVTGVPETFVVDSKGVIRVHYAGPITDEVMNEMILPALK
jgi:cytochrome c biogenesis protein CcmG/thiol:disulfide interchange protein DsbE